MVLLVLLALSALATTAQAAAAPCGRAGGNRSAKRRKSQNRIINGRQSKTHIPWMVKIVVNGASCGGAFITPGHVLTAAHCFCDLVLQCPRAQLGQ